ncbi:MAG: hypothetical protein QM487_10770, partial [Candidatus Marithrix sp.]
QIVWDYLNYNCNEVDTFLTIFRNITDRTKNTIRSYAQKNGSKAVEDFGAGYIDGLVNIISIIAKYCNNKCSELGRISGELSAVIFCATSQAIGKTSVFKGMADFQNIICGEPYRTSCESRFYSQAVAECPHYTSSSVFGLYYSASSGGCCSYNPDKID